MMPQTFSLNNFEGPLDLLLLLVQKDEMQIVEIAIHLLTQQLLKKLKEDEDLNKQADALATLAHLLVLKSRKIAPNLNEESSFLLDAETRIALIDQLLEQTQFKDIADHLEEYERRSQTHFTRMLPSLQEEEKIKTLGLEDVTLEHLKKLFDSIYREAKEGKHSPQVIQGQKWEVGSKIEELLILITPQKEFSFAIIFDKSACKEELIVTFLAILELIKQEKISVKFDNNELKFIRN